MGFWLLNADFNKDAVKNLDEAHLPHLSLSGVIVDQAALHSVLKKIRNLGLTIISVNPQEYGRKNGKTNKIPLPVFRGYVHLVVVDLAATGSDGHRHLTYGKRPSCI